MEHGALSTEHEPETAGSTERRPENEYRFHRTDSFFGLLPLRAMGDDLLVLGFGKQDCHQH